MQTVHFLQASMHHFDHISEKNISVTVPLKNVFLVYFVKEMVKSDHTPFVLSHI